MKEKKKRKGLKTAVIISGSLLIVIIIAISVYWVKNTKVYDWELEKVYEAGYQEKDVTLEDGSVIHYAEGPEGEIPLLLIHGQCADWKSYAKCLPKLAKEYHVYVIDVYGHGGSSKAPEKYNANAIGADLTWFLENIIKESAVVSGHSSGGLLAAWLAANAPQDVSAVVLEDPPYFSCEDGRKEMSWNYIDLSTVCHNYLNQTEVSDFTLYYFENMAGWTFMPDAKESLVKYAKNYRSEHPGKRLVIGFLPPSMTGVMDAMDTYDPRFGESFYDGSWNAGFDHAETLSKIQCPAILIYASHKISEDGILQGAMTQEDANRVLELVDGCQLITSKVIHCVHSLDKNTFMDAMDQIREQIKEK